MGRFLGPHTQIPSSGIFGGATAISQNFLLAASNSANPNIASGAGAAVRDSSGTWHLVNVTALAGGGAYGAFFDTANSQWVITTNNGFVGILPLGAVTLSRTINAGAGLHLSDMTFSANDNLYLIGTLDNQIVTSAPPFGGSFAAHPAHGPGSYATQGMRGAINVDFADVSVGGGSGGNGICNSSDGVTWVSLATLFTTSSDNFVTSNTIIFDGTQYVAVGSSQIATSLDGIIWTLTNISAATSNANVIGYDEVLQTGSYYVGDTNGNVFVASTPAGIASASPTHLSGNALRCAVVGHGIALMGDAGGSIFRSSDGGASWHAENPGLGTTPILTSLARA